MVAGVDSVSISALKAFPFMFFFEFGSEDEDEQDGPSLNSKRQDLDSSKLISQLQVLKENKMNI